MSNNTRLLIFGGGALILLTFLVLVIYPLFRSETETEGEQLLQDRPANELQPLPSDQERLVASQNDPIEPVVSEDEIDELSDRADIERTTRYFVERFGSYSNFSGFQNITSLEGLMTDPMKSYANSLIDQSRSETEGYYGVTTRLISATITDYEKEQRATVEIIVQQEVQRGLNAAQEISAKSGRVELVHRAEGWFIDGIYYD